MAEDQTDPRGAGEPEILPDPNYEQSLPIWDKDADSAGPPVLAPDGSAWEPQESSDTWESKFVADPQAAEEATRRRMNEQAERDKAEAVGGSAAEAGT